MYFKSNAGTRKASGGLGNPQAGFTLIQVLVAVGIIALCGIASVQSLVLLNQRAATTRLMNNARAIVERNINTALTVPYTSSNIPSILATTSASGSTYDDDSLANGYVPIAYLSNGTTSYLNGTLKRTVVSESNSAGATILRVTFSISYTYRNRSYSYSSTTLRTTDS